MSKPPASWKNFEARIAKYFGGKRRGAYVFDGRVGKNDVVDKDGSPLDGWSIEVKLNKRPTYHLMFDAALQAEKAANNNSDIPIAVVKKNHRGIKDNDALVIIRFEKFREFFLE